MKWYSCQQLHSAIVKTWKLANFVNLVRRGEVAIYI